jgi:hypothetical protein
MGLCILFIYFVCDNLLPFIRRHTPAKTSFYWGRADESGSTSGSELDIFIQSILMYKK